MKKFRPVLALLLALSVLLSCLPMASAAAHTDIVDADAVQETPSALTLGAMSQEFRESNAHKYADTDIVRAIIVLESAPAADLEGTPAEKSAYRLHLAKEQAAVRKAMKMPVEPAYEFNTLLNGFSCDVAYGEIENIAKIDGVSAVYIANHYEAPRVEMPQNNYANQIIGNAAMNKSGYNGQGIVVAVLDTGLRVTHEAFQVYKNMPLTQVLTSSSLSKASVSAKYINAKVPFAYDYADKDNDVADSHGHGTHVSGTAVGYAESSDGAVVMSGGAPAAQLVSMKIFQDAGGGTSSDIYFSALEDAYNLGVDVVNMSIGAQNGFTYDSSLETAVFGNIYKRMEESGIVMCVAAGNEYSMAQFSSVGFIGTDYTDFGTIASPAAYEGNISIAAVENAAYPGYALTFNGKSFAFTDSCQDGTHGWLQVFGGKSTSVVVLKNADGTDLALGTEADFASVNVTGKIAVVSRGEISFQEKMDFAANAGAVGVIVVNNTTGGISMSIDPFAIPAISVDVSLKETFLSAASTAKLSTPSAMSYVDNPSAYQMCDFSNWGTSPMLTLDPTISSIGGMVYSSMPTADNAYDIMSGTSMACPNAAGTFACVLEAVREAGAASTTSGSRKTLTKIESKDRAIALMESTGILLQDADDYVYSVRRQGAGLASSANSANTYFSGAYISNPIQELGDDKNKTGTYTMSLKLVNEGYETVTYDNFNTYILFDQAGQVGEGYGNALSSGLLYAGNEGSATVTYKVSGQTVSSITLKPSETKTVTVTITLADDAKSYYDTYFPNGTFVEGFVSFSNTVAEGDTETLSLETHATFLAYYGDWTQAPAMEKLSTFHLLQANYALNNEIYQDGQTYAEAGLALGDVLLQKFGTFYTDMNAIYTVNSDGEAINYLGGNIMDVGNENTVYNPAYHAFSTPNTNAAASDAIGITVLPHLLRNARYVKMTVKDKSTGTVYMTETADYIPKDRYDQENSQWSPHVSFEWKGTKSNSSSTYVPSGTVATVSLDVMVPYGESANQWQKNALSFDVTVDYTAPVIQSAIYDASKQVVSVTASDSQYLANILLCSSDYQTVHATKNLSPAAKGESCTAVFDVSGITDKNIVAVVFDYASNQVSKTVTAGTVDNTNPTEPTTPPTEPTEPTTDATEPTEPSETTSATFRLVQSASDLTSGEYLILATASGSYANYSYYIMTTTQDGSYKVMQGGGLNFDSLPSGLTLDTSAASQYVWTVSGNANGFTAKTDAGSYLNSTAGSTALTLGSSASTWAGSYSSSNYGFTLSSNSRYLALRDDVSTTGDNGACVFSTISSTSGNVYMHLYKKEVAACTHANTTTSTTPATCTEAGETVVTCKDCGEVVSTTVIPATGHSPITTTTAATCTAEGKTVESCQTCKAVLSTTAIPALGHDYKYTSNNNGTHKISCSRCSYSSSADCTMVNDVCSYCGYTVEPELPEDPEIPAVELTAGKYVIAANVDGVYYAMPNAFASKINGAQITVTNGKVAAADAEGYVIVLDETEGGWTISDGAGNYLKYNSSTNLAKTTTAYAWAISEGTNGTWRVAAQTSGRGLVFRAKTYNQFGGYATTNCTAGSTEYYDIEFLPIDGATSEPDVPCTHENTRTDNTPATCTAAGKTVVTCVDCGEIIETTTIPALGHDYKYTSNNDGTHRVSCSRCSYNTNEDCGLVDNTCPDCGYTVEPELPEDPEIPVGELTAGKYVIAANVDGVYYAMPNAFASKMSGTTITVTNGKVAAADAEGYVIVLEEADGGWTISDGAGNYLKYNSSTNLAKTTTAYAWAISEGTNGTWRVAAQTSGRGLVFRAKTYNQFGGYATTNCTAGSTEYYDIEFLPIDGATTEPEIPCAHENTSTYTTPASCTEDGETVVTCEDCGEVVSTTVIPAAGHNSATATTDATCTSEGKTVEYCKTCNATLNTTVIPALGHNYKYTSNNDGTHKITCSRCSYSSSANCTLVDNTCPDCGYTVEPELPEDPEIPVGELTAGKYVIAANVDGVYYAMPNAFASKMSGAAITVTNGKVAAADAEGYVIVLEEADGGWTISDGAGNYLKYNSSTNLAKTTTAYAWAISAGTNGTWRVAAQTSGRGLVFRAKTYNQFGGYATSNCTAGSTEYYDIEFLPIDGATSEPDVPCTHENTSTSTTDATCTAAGKTVVTCDDCGEVISTETIPALGHDYKYTSNNDGTHKITCSRCSYSSSANCGLVDNTCPDCGYTAEPELPEDPEVPVGELTAGKYVIAANVNGVYYAMSNTFATKIAGTEITVTNGKVAAADAEGYVIVLEEADGGWTISDGNGNYLKYSSSTNLANSTTAYAWAISEGTNGTWRVAAQTSGRGLVFRAKTYNQFGGYNPSNCTAGSAEYFDIEFLPVEGASAPTEPFSVKISHSLNLASDISINYMVLSTELDGYSNFYLECKVPTYEGNTKTGTTTVIIEPVLNGYFYYFTMNGLTAVQMNDIIDCVLYATKDGKTYATEVDSYSIGTYAYNQLAKDTTVAELKVLCAELLRYGAKAQIFKSYRTNALVDASMTAEHTAMLTDLDGVKFGNNNTTLNDVTNPTVTWGGKALILDSKVTLRFVINPSNYTGNVSDLSVRVTYNNLEGETVTETLTNGVLYNPDLNYYSYDFDSLRAAELRTVVSAAVYANGKQVSPTLQYSPDTYGNNKTGDLLVLCKSLMAYSDAALAYFKK